MRRRKSYISLCVLMSLFFIGVSIGYAKTLKVQLVYPETSSVADNAKHFAQKVSKYSSGKLKVKIFYPGQLVKAGQGLTAMQRGMIDGYIGSMLYFSGVVPEVNGEWLPYSWRNVNEALDIYYNYGFLDVMRQALENHGTRYVAPISVASMGLMTKFPIKSLEDMKGKKIRAVGMEAKIVKALGAASVSLAGAEQYSALQRGTVDGTDYPWYTLEDYKFYEVVDYISTPPLHTPGIVEILLSGKTWEKLSAQEKEAVDKAGWNTAIHSAKLTVDNDKKAYKFAKENGITNVELSGQTLSNFKEATEPLYKQHMKDSELCAEQVKILGKYFKRQEIEHPSVEAIEK